MSHTPRKRFGQNFLQDERIIQQIVQAIAPRDNETVVEIGPGQGALTQALLPHCAELHLLELDRDLVTILQGKYGHLDTVHIHSGDALQFDFTALKQEGRSLRIVGNLPYNISTPLIFHLLQQVEQIDEMVFMLQKEVVDRFAATPGCKEYGRLAVMMQFHCAVRALFEVPPTAFYPQPKVDSAVVCLYPHTPQNTTVDSQLLSRLVAQSFAQRRKTLRNNLKGFLNEEEIRAAGVDPAVRAETLTLAEFIHLTQVWSLQQQQ